jgi:NDP-sugar pyrophosphorylase family protein
MMNSDVISRYPFADLLEFHLRKGGEGTIMSNQVDDPSRYGVIMLDDNNLILGFEEKPKVFVGRVVNAGHHIFEPSVIDRVPLHETFIEREVFPRMVSSDHYVEPVILLGCRSLRTAPIPLPHHRLPYAANPMLLAVDRFSSLPWTAVLSSSNDFVCRTVMSD